MACKGRPTLVLERTTYYTVSMHVYTQEQMYNKFYHMQFAPFNNIGMGQDAGDAMDVQGGSREHEAELCSPL